MFIYLSTAALGLRCCTWAFSSCGERGYSQLQCAGFSLWWLLLLRSMGSSMRASVVAACGLSSRGARTQLLRGMWYLPGPGLEPMSPALAGGFSTTAPPGKSHQWTLILAIVNNAAMNMMMHVSFQDIVFVSFR